MHQLLLIDACPLASNHLGQGFSMDSNPVATILLHISVPIVQTS